MTNKYGGKISDDDFIKDFPLMGASGLVEKYGITEANAYRRRKHLQKKHGIVLTAPSKGGKLQELDRHPAAINIGIQNGQILVGSDSHYWPGIVSTAHKAFVKFCQRLKPKVIVKNGDELDFPSISRFAHGWETRPTVAQEIAYANDMLGEIEKACPEARLLWPVGNHDSRLETKIATSAPELAAMKGVHLRDHFSPRWEPCFAVFVNEDTVIKHRIKGGVYAPRNNTLFAGRTVVTGHLHSLKVWPHSDYNGTRWGVDAGSLADPYGPQFYGYTELNPMDWRSGFVLLTFVNGRLLYPEVIWVSGKDEVQFRGEIIHV